MSTVEVEPKQKLSKTVVFTLASAISTIMAAAFVTMWAIIADPPGDTVGKAFLTIFLAGGFAFAVIAESRADHEADYVTPGRIAALVLITLSGFYLTWQQVELDPWDDFWAGDFGAWLGTVLLLEGVVATLILFWPRMVATMKTPLVRYTFDAGIALVILVSVLISFAWTTWDLDWPEIFWRVVLAIGVLALVTFSLPLVISKILAPHTPKPVYPQHQQYPVRQNYDDAPTAATAAPAESTPAASAPWDAIVARTIAPPAATPKPMYPGEGQRVVASAQPIPVSPARGDTPPAPRG
jgi:hypothetical protein